MMRILALVLLLAPFGSIAEAQGMPAERWYRGNTHSHTTRSDGDSPPDSVVRWYRDNNYHFLFITDHETLTDPAPLQLEAGKLLLIPGQEVTQRISDSTHAERWRQAHVNALGVTEVVVPLGANGRATGITMREGYARNLAAIRSAGGIPQINHPNYRWSVRLGDLLEVPDSTLIEIYNAHPGVNNAGGRTGEEFAPPAEALWDSLLTRGKLLFAVADDDSHHFKLQNADAWELTRPGRGWVMVRASAWNGEAILGALRRGDFYASTGVTFGDLSMKPDEISIAIDTTARYDDRRYMTEFIGREGLVLMTVYGATAGYRIRGDEGYVRARVTDSNGRRAWTQPVMVDRRTERE